MKMRLYLKFIIITLSCMVFGISSSCNQSTKIYSATIVNTVFNATVSYKPEQSVPIRLTDAPKPKVTQQKATQTQNPSQMPISTVPGTNAKAKVQFLLKTNGNCSLPCWWGIVPGHTTWPNAESYLTPLTSQISLLGSQPMNGIVAFYNVKFPNPDESFNNDSLGADILVNNNDVIDVIDFSSTDTLPNLLKKLDIPSEILINIVTIGPGPYDFTLILFYNNGIMLVYNGSTFSADSSFINICPMDIAKVRPEMWVWDIVKYKTFDDVGKFAVISPSSPQGWFKSINSVSDMQPETFYNYFINSASTECIKTPWAVW